EELSAADAQQVAVLYALYAGGKLLFLFCLLAGTWLFVRREPLPRIGIGSGLAFIVAVGVLFLLAPSDLNPLVAWQAGITVPVFLASGGLLAGMPRERRTRGSRMLAVVCFLIAMLWLLYTPAFLEAGPDNQPGRLTLLRWIAGHNSYFDMLFEFLLGFGMILAVLDDVFHEAEEARISRLRDVAASEARLSQIIRAASEGIVLLDGNRRVVHANPAALATLGATEPDLLGEPFDRFVTADGAGDLWTVATERADGMPGTPGAGYELCGRRLDESEFPLEISLRAAGSGPEDGYVLILRDRTQRVRAEQERERLQSEMAQHARLETIGRMVSGVAHELNNPLTAILAFGQDLLSQARTAADTEALNTIVQQSQRCRMIVQDLLTFARSKRDDRQPIDPGELILRVQPALLRQAESQGVQLEVSIEDDLPGLEVNPSALEQVLTNLAVNAFQAVGANGTVTISAQLQQGRLALIVEDNGPGVPEEVLPRLFEPFFTTKATGKGTGLGLSVSHAIIEQHGGTLRAENRSGPGIRGARFTVLLPFIDRRSVPRAAAGEPARAAGLQTPLGAERRVLVIDDEASIRSAIRRYLERRGWRVEEACDGLEALDRLGLNGSGTPRTDQYDAIITDLKMPGISGIELHDRLAASDPAGLEKLVLITGDTASTEVADFVARLRQPLIQKPFDMRALADVLDRSGPARA
ncbi:MAG TPA: ATP-binding protein, partial [Gemmatimonadales bacterium]|nr:ATP-binding protein [Gemmatimonadales bacterium]